MESNQGTVRFGLIAIIVGVVVLLAVGGLIIFAVNNTSSEEIPATTDEPVQQQEETPAVTPEQTTPEQTTPAQTVTPATQEQQTTPPATQEPTYTKIDTTQIEDKEEENVVTPFDDSVKIHFIDIGQGDAILIEHLGEYIMIDAGKSTSESAKSKASLDKHILNLKSLGWLLTTHQDSDHIGYAEYVMTTVPTSRYYDNGNTGTSKTYTSLMSYVTENKIPYTTLTSVGSDISLWDDVVISVVGVNTSGGKDINDDSICLVLECDGCRVAFTGDISSDVEDTIASKIGDVDVLKVAHHGSSSSTSESFLSVVKPEVAVISVGKNSYGHPTEEALTRLSSAGATVYRTDVYGCVECVIDDGTYSIVYCTI